MTTSKPFSWEAFHKIPVVGIMRNMPQQQIENIVKYYSEAGFSTIEITMNSANAPETISALIKTFGNKLNIGAGTVCTMKDLEKALSAGAQFIVTPIVNEDVITECVAQKIPVFPGAFTPTEIYKAWSLGADMIKIFPASRLGAEYIKEVLAPLNFLKLIPTGGITIDNVTDFLKAGAKGLGMGSQLFPGPLIENGRWEELSIVLSDFYKKVTQFQHKL